MTKAASGVNRELTGASGARQRHIDNPAGLADLATRLPYEARAGIL